MVSKPVTKSNLSTFIDLATVLASPRVVGGHVQMLKGIFTGNAPCIAYYCSPGVTTGDDHWQGVTSLAYRFDIDGTICVLSDYFGSNYCCDIVIGASDATITSLITTVVNNARLFISLEKAIKYCSSVQERVEDFPMWYCKFLVSQLSRLDAFLE
jgi:hypothetical protein